MSSDCGRWMINCGNNFSDTNVVRIVIKTVYAESNMLQICWWEISTKITLHVEQTSWRMFCWFQLTQSPRTCMHERTHTHTQVTLNGSQNPARCRPNEATLLLTRVLDYEVCGIRKYKVEFPATLFGVHFTRRIFMACETLFIFFF